MTKRDEKLRTMLLGAHELIHEEAERGSNSDAAFEAGQIIREALKLLGVDETELDQIELF